MARYKLTLEYDGGPFVGWQRQTNGPSVQAALEDATRGLCGALCAVQGAGRTDAGVHALGQVAHVDLPKAYPDDTVRDALNAHLTTPAVAVLSASRADDEFHARFDAVERAYLYRVIDRRAPTALDRGRVWRMPYRLDAEAMDQGAQYLLGRHDFTTFRDAQCQADSPVKTLDQIRVVRVSEEVQVTCAARSFLHRQVRSIVGSLAEVGRGKWRPDDVGRVLAAQDRSACGPVAPPDGLYLARVRYGGD